jgi:hypothetical protein
MAVTVEQFLRGTNNIIELTLTDEGQAVPNLQLATQVDLNIGGLLITRTSSGQGINYNLGGGVIVINPGLIPEDLTSLPIAQLPTTITVYDQGNQQGVRFGGPDSEPELMFSVR